MYPGPEFTFFLVLSVLVSYLFLFIPPNVKLRKEYFVIAFHYRELGFCVSLDSVVSSLVFYLCVDTHIRSHHIYCIQYIWEGPELYKTIKSTQNINNYVSICIYYNNQLFDSLWLFILKSNSSTVIAFQTIEIPFRSIFRLESDAKDWWFQLLVRSR